MATARMIANCSRVSNDSQDVMPVGTRNRSDAWQRAIPFRILARGACVAGALQATSILAGIVLTAVLARGLGTLEFGVYALSMNQAQLLAAAVGGGIPLTLVRFLPQYLANNQFGHARGAVKALATATYTSSGLIVVFGTLALWFKSQQASINIVGGVLTVFLAGLVCAGNFQTELARANRRLVLAYLPMGAAWPILMTGVYGLLLLAGEHVTTHGVLITSCSLLLLILLIQLGMLHKLLDDLLGSARPLYEPRAWRHVALPLWIVTLGSMTLATSDVVLVGLITDSAQAASYFVAKRLSAIVSFSLIAANTIVAPLISEFFHANRRRALESTLTNAALLGFVPALICAVALVAAGQFALRLFGKEYTIAWPELCILVFGQLVNVSTGAVGYLMNLTGQQLASMLIFAGAAVLQITTGFLLVPKFGGVGAAIANAVSLSAWNICLVLYVWHYLGLDPTVFRARRLMRFIRGTTS